MIYDKDRINIDVRINLQNIMKKRVYKSANLACNFNCASAINKNGERIRARKVPRLVKLPIRYKLMRE